MASGIKISDEVVQAFDAVKGHKFKYVTYRVSDDETQIIVESQVKESTWEDFQAHFPLDKPLWAVYDFDYKSKEDHNRNKLVVLSWCPDELPIKKKMMHSSSTAALRKKCNGVAYQANDRSDLSYESVKEKVLERSY
ncbi:uncharacterized protein [Branchiostoma lanceolatum]|uniref:CFL2 protein n=1 Tax=Branchiostoma lanceolatum TaxID=7740 RepID=A0A8J9ZUQ6_BRALA|nr:CFL2 [Branchiostoma lanceolatum]